MQDADSYSLAAYLAWSGPSTTLQAFRGKLTSVDQKVVPALSTSYEQFCEVFNSASPPKQPATGILMSPDECFLNTLKCMLSWDELGVTKYNMRVGQRCAQTCFGDLWNESSSCFFHERDMKLANKVYP